MSTRIQQGLWELQAEQETVSMGTGFLAHEDVQSSGDAAREADRDKHGFRGTISFFLPSTKSR